MRLPSLHEHISEPISTADLARVAGMSKAVFHRRFKAVTTLSPLQFMKAIRLNNAAAMIAGGMNIAEGDYLPIVRVAPVYPARALSRGLEGFVDLQFTVTTTGTVKDPIVLQSTSSLFERAAIRAVLKFKYKPRVVDGVPVEVPGVKTRISFQLED